MVERAPILSLLIGMDILLLFFVAVEEYLRDNLLSRDILFYLLASIDLLLINCLTFMINIIYNNDLPGYKIRLLILKVPVWADA